MLGIGGNTGVMRLHLQFALFTYTRKEFSRLVSCFSLVVLKLYLLNGGQ
jgi:hypothetical protein